MHTTVSLTENDRQIAIAGIADGVAQHLNLLRHAIAPAFGKVDSKWLTQFATGLLTCPTFTETRMNHQFTRARCQTNGTWAFDVARNNAQVKRQRAILWDASWLASKELSACLTQLIESQADSDLGYVSVASLKGIIDFYPQRLLKDTITVGEIIAKAVESANDQARFFQ